MGIPMINCGLYYFYYFTFLCTCGLRRRLIFFMHETIFLSLSNPLFTPFTKSSEIIKPFPKGKPRRKASCGKKRGKTRIFNYTPKKRELENSKKKKYQMVVKKKISRKKIIVSSSDEDTYIKTF